MLETFGMGRDQVLDLTQARGHRFTSPLMNGKNWAKTFYFPYNNFYSSAGIEHAILETEVKFLGTIPLMALGNLL